MKSWGCSSRPVSRGLDVVRLHTGEPAIYGAIGEQMDALDRMGIEYEVVPGISAFQAAAASLRVELTAPEIAQTIILTRGRAAHPCRSRRTCRGWPNREPRCASSFRPTAWLS